MDGPPGVTQCPIQPGGSFTYDFVVGQEGTFWYHSHSKGQYIDGLRGLFPVHDPAPPFKYAQELAITASGWYHTQAPALIHYLQHVSNGNNNEGAEPIPDSALLNDSQNATFRVKPSTTYLLRLANIGSFVGSYFSIGGHDMTKIEVDGVYTDPQITNQIYTTVSQRYSVLITTRSTTNQNFLIRSRLDTDMFDSIPAGSNPNVYEALMYNVALPMLQSVQPPPVGTPFDDFRLVSRDRMKAMKVDRQIVMVMGFTNDAGVNRYDLVVDELGGADTEADKEQCAT